MKFKAKKLIEYVAMLGIWLGLVLLFGLLSDNFLSPRTFVTLANRIPALAVIAAGMTLVLIIGGIDLSVGSVLGLCGAVVGLALVNFHVPFWAAILLGLGTGLVAGTVNGVVSVGLGIPSFIVTLGMLEIARGLAYLTTNSQTKYIGSAVEGLATPVAGAVSPAFLIAVMVIVVGQIVLARTVFGRYLVAIGTNEQAVRLAGINPKPAKIAVFALLGLLTGLGGVFYTSRLGSSDPNAGVGLELSAIAAVVIGGTSLMGGRGSVVNTFFGVLIIATLEAGLAQVGASEPTKRVITGLVIVSAVVLDAWRHHLTGKRFLLLKHLFSWTPSARPPNPAQQVVERERVRIARDIHDEIGANLTQIALLSELAKSDLAKPEQAKGHMDEVFRTAQSLTRSLDEIVWAVNPAGDTVEQFATHLCTFAPRFLESAGVRCRLDVPDELPAITLPASVRHHLHLGVKESLHNIAKHAHATEVWLHMKLAPDTITLTLEDNGRGFEPGSDTNPGADGLANLRQRMKEIGGSFEQQSQSGHGTCTTLVAPLKSDE